MNEENKSASSSGVDEVTEIKTSGKPELVQSEAQIVVEKQFDASIEIVKPEVSVVEIESSNQTVATDVNYRPYKDLIKEVYIDQIRSAIIVDDKYPTLDQLLNPSLTDTLKNKDYPALLKVVEACRSQDKPWLVDVHDGKDLEKGDVVANHFKRLHQSDLMILDYSLDADENSNIKVCNVLKSLASNSYSNLVIIYTQCSDTELLQRVLNLVRSLTFKNPQYELANRLALPQEFEQWESEDGVDTNLNKNLNESLSLEIFLKLFQEKDSRKWEGIIGTTPLGQFFNERAVPKDQYFIKVMKWLISTKYSTYSSEMSPYDLGFVEFEIGNINWVRTDTLFLTVISKETDPAELPTKLLEALEASNPSPHRLLMSKIRAVLDERGISAERTILEKQYMQAGWLKEMLDAKENDERDWKIKRTVAHHWEELANTVSSDIRKYANELLISILHEENRVIKNIIKRFTLIDINDLAQKNQVAQEWNSYVCSKDVDGHHLMTGHILEISSDNDTPSANRELWVCLTPICDLVPRDGNKFWGGIDIKASNVIPFKAVKLIDHPLKKGLADATKNECIFIGSGESLKCYKFSDNSAASPTWNQFFAHNSGKFGLSKELTLTSISWEIKDGIPVNTKSHRAKLTNQLRYEYALHLLQKLGGTFSRIGLEFIKPQ